MNAPVPPPPSTPGVLTRDPVRWTWVIYSFVQAVVTVLLATETITTRVAALITGCAVAAYVAVSELFVRNETVPRKPLEQLALEQEQQ